MGATWRERLAGKWRILTGGLILAVELDVTLPSIEDTEQAVKIVHAAHDVCPYSNATRGNIEVLLTANGAPVE